MGMDVCSPVRYVRVGASRCHTMNVLVRYGDILIILDWAGLVFLTSFYEILLTIRLWLTNDAVHYDDTMEAWEACLCFGLIQIAVRLFTMDCWSYTNHGHQLYIAKTHGILHRASLQG